MLNNNPQIMQVAKELAELNVASIEQLAKIQKESFEEITNAGITSLKKATSVKDLDTARAYFAEQTIAFRLAGENAADRSKTIVDIAKTYTDDLKAIFEKTVTA